MLSRSWLLRIKQLLLLSTLLTSLSILFCLYRTLADVSSLLTVSTRTHLGGFSEAEWALQAGRSILSFVTSQREQTWTRLHRTGLHCRGAENPEGWPVVNTRVVASLFTSRPGPGVAWWSTEMPNLQTLACGCFWNLSSSTSTGQTATVHFQQPEGGSVRTTFCLTVGTHVRLEILATHPQLLLGKHCPDRQFCVT